MVNPKPVHDKAEPGHNDPSADRLKSNLDKLYSLHPKLIDLSLTRVERFLHDLDDPHLKLPPVIHVAGTNGKGSTIATLRAILEAHGKTCHVATSPHLVHINERIVIAGQEIEDDHLSDLIEECLEANKGRNITFFEMIVAITFLAFSRAPADFCLIETGLGGRLDATNVIPNPAATIITTISMDHQDFLGRTLSAIAQEKTGIMKTGAPCIIAKQTDAAEAENINYTFQSKAASTGSPLHAFGATWTIEPRPDHILYQDAACQFKLPYPNLTGSHQIFNVGSAIAALRVIDGLDLDAKKISTALEQIHWPGRLQRIDKQDGTELWIDGGHNDSAGQVLAQQLKRWKDESGKPTHLIIGMLKRKDPIAFIEPMIPHASSITCIAVPGEDSSFEPAELADLIRPLKPAHLDTAPNYQDAIKDKDGRTLITGSLYLMGHILSQQNSEAPSPKIAPI